MEDAMTAGYHVGLGLNRVDPARYGGWDGKLNACVADAQAMQRIVRGRGISETFVLLDEQATAQEFFDVLRELAHVAVAGDLVVVTRSGHGGEVPDGRGGKRQTWVLFDRQVLDTEIQAALCRFRAGVRILVVSDACHSETDTREVPAGGAKKSMPAGVAAADYAAHQSLYDALLLETTPGTIQASVIHLSACRDDQTALDGERNGAFTEALVAIYDWPFKGTYQQFYNCIARKMADDGRVQVPTFNRDGAHSAAFLLQQPFTV
jgi:hypothetical protein